MAIDPNATVTIRFGTLCTDIMAAIHYGANDRECLVKDVAAMKASEFIQVMVDQGHIQTDMNGDDHE